MAKQKNWFILDELPEFILGADDEDDPEGDSGDSGDDAGDLSQDDNGAAGSNSEGSSEHDDADDPKVKGLKSALDAERAKSKAAEKKATALQKEKDAKDLADKSEIEQAQIRAEKAEEKATKLAAGYVRDALNGAIKDAANKLKFLDVTDALDGVDRSKLTYEQDEDDPTEVSIDLKILEKEVKALAQRKPHFLEKGTEDGGPTGGQFGGSKKKQKTPSDTYKERYPSLA